MADKRKKTSVENGKLGGRPPGSVANHTILVAEARKKLISAYLEQQEPIDQKLIEMAKAGDIQAIKELHDRVYGKSLQTNENINVKKYRLDDEELNKKADALVELQKHGTGTDTRST